MTRMSVLAVQFTVSIICENFQKIKCFMCGRGEKRVLVAKMWELGEPRVRGSILPLYSYQFDYIFFCRSFDTKNQKFKIKLYFLNELKQKKMDHLLVRLFFLSFSNWGSSKLVQNWNSIKELKRAVGTGWRMFAICLYLCIWIIKTTVSMGNSTNHVHLVRECSSSSNSSVSNGNRSFQWNVGVWNEMLFIKIMASVPVREIPKLDKNRERERATERLLIIAFFSSAQSFTLRLSLYVYINDMRIILRFK